jgi:alkylhydroperoxidase family enzyme
VEAVKANPMSAAISPRLRTLLAIAAGVQRDRRSVTTADVERARSKGATDLETVLAAAFGRFNRYVDGLGIMSPVEESEYMGMAQLLVEHGYSAAGAILAR